MHELNPEAAQRNDIANIFGVHPSTVSRWKKAGCPVNRDNATYSTLNVHKWLVDQAIQDMGEKDFTSGDSPALERYREARAEMAELSLQVRKGELIEIDEVFQAWAARVAEISAGLEHLADRMPPLLVGKTREEIADEIRGEIWRLRDQYQRTGKYCEMEGDDE